MGLPFRGLIKSYPLFLATGSNMIVLQWAMKIEFSEVLELMWNSKQGDNILSRQRAVPCVFPVGGLQPDSIGVEFKVHKTAATTCKTEKCLMLLGTLC